MLGSQRAVVCTVIVAAYILIAIGGGMIFPDWNTAGGLQPNQPPSSSAWLGTDALGRSVLAKTLLGARISLTVAFVANIIAIPIGMFLGALAGTFGRWVDTGVVWLCTTLAAVPGIVRVVAVKFAFQDVAIFPNTPVALDLAGMSGVCLALAMTYWIRTCRLVRTETLVLRESEFVLAARAIGRTRTGILFKHILPNVAHIGVVNFSLGFVAAIGAEVVLSYLGLGAATGEPSWGNMIHASRTGLLVGRWWEPAAALTAMFVLVLAVHILGDRLRDAMNPKLKSP